MAINTWRVQKAPALPIPPVSPVAEHGRVLNNTLRIYFNQVDASDIAALNAAIDLQNQIEYEEIMGWVLS